MTQTEVVTLFPYFRAESWQEVGDGNLLATTALDRNTNDFAHLIGHEAIISHHGHVGLYIVIGVERFAHGPPWYSGERVALLVKSWRCLSNC